MKQGEDHARSSSAPLVRAESQMGDDRKPSIPERRMSSFSSADDRSSIGEVRGKKVRWKKKARQFRDKCLPDWISVGVMGSTNGKPPPFSSPNHFDAAADEM